MPPLHATHMSTLLYTCCMTTASWAKLGCPTPYFMWLYAGCRRLVTVGARCQASESHMTVAVLLSGNTMHAAVATRPGDTFQLSLTCASICNDCCLPLQLTAFLTCPRPPSALTFYCWTGQTHVAPWHHDCLRLPRTPLLLQLAKLLPCPATFKHKSRLCRFMQYFNGASHAADALR